MTGRSREGYASLFVGRYRDVSNSLIVVIKVSFNSFLGSKFRTNYRGRLLIAGLMLA
jgi:hypothetical protein